MKEYFEGRRLSGSINIVLKDDEGNVIRNWQADKLTLANNIIEIVQDYAKQGYRLTLRQLYYQLVTKNYIPNHDTAYKKISSLKDDLCYSGKLDWDCIEDRGRVPYLPYYVKDVENAIEDTIETYRLDRQNEQPICVELWSEKDAISGILKRVTQKYHIQLCINKGYTSSSAVYGAYQRFSKKIAAGQKVIILYFGDHDPSGLDMVRDIEDRLLFMFTRGTTLKIKKEAMALYDSIGYTPMDLDIPEKIVNRLYSDNRESSAFDEAVDYFHAEINKYYIKEKGLFQVKHIGLTKDQIKKFNLPPNPAKITDPRANDYIKKHGKISWEVDALPPAELVSIVEANIRATIDMEQFEEMLKQEQRDIKTLKSFFKK